MVKNKVLTPVLACVLGLSVVGSGVAYYALNKGSSEQTLISKAAVSISNTADKAGNAFNGKIDYSYNSTAKISFGKDFNSEIGTDVKDIEITTDTKQKGNKAGADVKVKYDGKDLASLKTVIDRENKNAYLQVPELSDAYLKADEKYMNSLNEKAKDETSDNSVYKNEFDFNSIWGDTTSESKDNEDIDFDKLFDDYEEVIKQNLSEPKDGKDIKGNIDNVEYKYTTKVYTVSGEQAKKTMKALLNKAKTDETLKKSFTQNNTGITQSYEEIIDEYIKNVDELKMNDPKETVDFDIYYNDDDFAGFNVSKDELSSKLITISTSDVFAVDFSYKADEDNMSVKGSLKSEKDIANGTFKFTAKDSDTDDINSTVTFKDIEFNDEYFKGEITTDVNYKDATSTVKNAKIVLKSNSTEEKSDIKYDISMDGKQYLTVSVTGTKTEASDVAVPSGGTIYDMNNETALNDYMKNCDPQKLQDNLKNALGEEVYNSLFGSSYTNDSSTALDDYSSDDLNLDDYASDDSALDDYSLDFNTDDSI